MGLQSPRRSKFGFVTRREESFHRYNMKIWRIAAVTALALSSFAADNVAPTKSELEEMYNKAFREFDANNFTQALKELDAIDARQPELAASQNLRGVILMRQGIHDKAEAALLEAVRIDSKFWNARFNLAEIPFLKKDWAEARNRFQQLLSNSESDLASEASQLIQYKILLTYLLEGKENMVDSILAKLELSPDTPAVDYVKAAVALQRKNEKEGKDWIAVAEKNFSPQLNKLFSESLYEVGWLEKPTGQARASLPLTTAAERSEKTKVLARSKFEQAQQALRQRDFATARKLIDEADKAEANQPATLNLRGEILMEQKEFDEADSAFKKAAKLDPKFREAQYNLAQIPFKKKDYAKARERFETLFKQTPGGDKNQASQLIKFKIYMTLLLEGKESPAHAMMEQFQFTGDTPALYYAQAAWEFKHGNPEKAADWTASAKKIYSPALNSIFADEFYDLGWMQSPEIAASSAPAFDTGSAIALQTEVSPAIEPSPIPDVAAASRRAKESTAESLSPSQSIAGPLIAGMEPTTSENAQSSSTQHPIAGPVGKSEEASAASVPELPSATGSPVVTTPAAEVPAATETKPSRQTSGGRVAAAKPAAVLAPAQPIGGIVSRQTLLVGGLLLAGVFMLAWLIIPGIRRRGLNITSYWHAASLARSRISEANIAPSEQRIGIGNHLRGGPRQVSLQLNASRPWFPRSALPSPKFGSVFGRAIDLNGGASEATAYQKAEADRQALREAKPVFQPSASLVVAQTAEVSLPPSIPSAETLGEMAAVAEVGATSSVEPVGEPQVEAIDQGQPSPHVPEPAERLGEMPAVAEGPFYSSNAISNEPVPSRTTVPVIMPQQPEPTEVPAAANTPRFVPAAHTPVQLTFSFEIVSAQLTPTFKVRALQVRPASKIVTMRLAPSQRPQPDMHPQVIFEIAKIESTGSGLGRVRLIKSPHQRQQPVAIASPSFEVTALQPVSSSDAAPVIQLAPTAQGQAHVQVIADFQMAKVEFSSCFEITGVVLDSTGTHVSVQLAATDSSAIEEGAVFDIANVRIADSGDGEILELDAVDTTSQQP